MEEKKRYFEGKGLYRLIKDGIDSEEDMDRVSSAVQDGKYGKSTVWRTTWEEDDGIKTPGTFEVYQRIINQRDVASSEEEETRSPRSRRDQCEIDTLTRKLGDINTKLNAMIVILSAAVIAGVGGWMHYFNDFTRAEECIIILTIGLCVMVLLWIRCECSRNGCCY